MTDRNNEEINIYELVLLLWKNKIVIFFVWFFIVISTVIYAKMKPDEYTSRVVYQILSNSSKINLGGVGSLLGVGKSFSSEVSKHKPTIESIDLYYEFLEKYSFKKELYPEAEFVDGKYFIDGVEITDFDAVKLLKDTHFSINFGTEDQADEFIITCITSDPDKSYRWLNLFRSMVVKRILEKEHAQNKEAIAYYRKKLSETISSELKMALNDLIIQEYKKGMLIGQRILQVNEVPRVATKKSGPKRLIMAIVGSFFGLFLGIGVVFLRHSITKFRESKNG